MNKCRKAADKKIRLLRMWSSYNLSSASNHTQQIWLCDKHFNKVSKSLNIEKCQLTEKENGYIIHDPGLQYLLVSIAPPNKPNLWGIIKTHLWNFILPPHIRLEINRPDSPTKEVN